jgi:hypothetical protein
MSGHFLLLNSFAILALRLYRSRIEFNRTAATNKVQSGRGPLPWRLSLDRNSATMSAKAIATRRVPDAGHYSAIN